MAPKYKSNGLDTEENWDQFTTYLEDFLKEPLKEFCAEKYMKRNQAVNYLLMCVLAANLGSKPSFWKPS